MITQIEYFLRRSYACIIMFGFKPAICLGIDLLFNRHNVIRRYRIKGTEVSLRSRNADIEVAMSGLHFCEYASLKLDNPKVIVDAGANVGTSALYFSKRFPAAQIIAIEPEQSNFEMLTLNVSDRSNVIPVHAALWGAKGHRIIKDRSTGDWGYTMIDVTGSAKSTGQDIECVTVNEIMKRFSIDFIDLLKLDIEGSEKNVLEHSSGWIHQVGVISVELHDRIVMGCDRSFYLATTDFTVFERSGEKVTAYRQ